MWPGRAARGAARGRLFGHEANAFTGAGQARQGRFEAADGGTLFLDEIGDRPPCRSSFSACFRKASSSGSAPTARPRWTCLIAATNADLSAAAAAKTFREDLYYRPNVIRLELPPSPSGEETSHCWYTTVSRFAEREGRSVPAVSAALAALDAAPAGKHPRVENALERAVLCRGDQIEVQDLPVEVREGMPTEARQEVSRSGERVLSFPIGTPLKEIESTVIRETLRHTAGDKKLASRLLGIAARTIYRRLEEDPAEETAG